MTSKEKKMYIEKRLSEVAEKNRALNELIDQIQNVLSASIKADNCLSFDGLKNVDPYPDFVVSPLLATPPPTPMKDVFFSNIKTPTGISKLNPATMEKYNANLRKAENNFQTAYAHYCSVEEARHAEIKKAESLYEQEKLKYEKGQYEQRQYIENLQYQYEAGNREAIESYCSLALERSTYPEGFPKAFTVSYEAESRGIIIDYEIPAFEIIPNIQEYSYVKTTDVINEKNRKASETKQIYANLIASISLRTSHELFEADEGGYIDFALFNGYVNSVDKATGQDCKAYLISTKATKSEFMELNLRRINSLECVKALESRISSKPHECKDIDILYI